VNLTTEQSFPLARAADLLEPVLGRRPHYSTLYTWTTKGLRGVRLESVRVGGSIVTSRESLDRFFARLDESRSGTPQEVTG
jgi:hypothetical protein